MKLTVTGGESVSNTRTTILELLDMRPLSALFFTGGGGSLSRVLFLVGVTQAVGLEDTVGINFLEIQMQVGPQFGL